MEMEVTFKIQMLVMDYYEGLAETVGKDDVSIADRQFGVLSGCQITDEIFTTHKLQDKYLS